MHGPIDLIYHDLIYHETAACPWFGVSHHTLGNHERDVTHDAVGTDKVTYKPHTESYCATAHDCGETYQQRQHTAVNSTLPGSYSEEPIL